MDNENKRSKGLIITLIIIIALLLGIVGYFVYKEYFTDSEVIDKKNQENKNQQKELSLTDPIVVELENKIEDIHSYCLVYDYFYQGNDINVSNISNDDKIDSVIIYLDLYSSYTPDDLKPFNNAYYYVLNDETVTRITNTIKTIFGENQEFTPGTSYDSTASIIKVDNKYLLKDNGCGFEGNRALNYTEKAVKLDNEIKIYKKVGYYFPIGYNDTAASKSILTSDKAGTNIIFSKISDTTSTNWITDDWNYFTQKIKDNDDKFDSYVFTFKLDSTGNYYFYSSEIVK